MLCAKNSMLPVFTASLRNLIVVMTLLISLSGCNDRQKVVPRAVDGVIDLTHWSFTEDGSVNLSGEWEFYWNKLLGPQDFDSHRHSQNIIYSNQPGSWNNKMVEGQTLSANGYATYRLLAKVARDQAVKAVRIKNQSSAYVLFINGKRVARNGLVGKSREEVVPQYRLEQNSFYDDSSSLEIILQVANFNHRKGGFWNPVKIGHADTLSSEQALQWIFDLALFGCLFVMGTYYLSLFVLFRNDRSSLYLALFTLVFAIRILFTGNYYITQIFPHIPWEPAYKIELGTIILGPASLLLFVSSVFNRKKRDWLQYSLLVLMSVYGLVTLFFPARISSQLVVPCQLTILAIFGYCLYILLRALLRGDIKAAILFSGMSILAVTAVFDILSANKIIYLNYLAHFGILFLILSQSFVLSLGFSDAFRQVQLLTRELSKKNRALQRLDKLKDEFLANTTHELRTPLNGIVGMAENMLSEGAGRLSASGAANLRTIIASGRRLGNLINDVLDFSRLKNRDIILNLKAVDVRTLTNVVLTVLRPLADQKSLQLINDVEDDLPPVHGDEERLQQVLYNLVGNAIKFTEYGSVRVSSAQEKAEVAITVADTGIGIATERLSEIFSPYVQENPARAQQSGGAGLGLAITRNLVILHGGTIEADSTSGKGSRFTFTMPVSEESPAASDTFLTAQLPAVSGEEGAPCEEQSSELTAKSVLVVDDDPINLQVVANHLGAAGIPFVLAGNGQKALAMIEKSGAPAMILLDIMMPKMDGYEVCRRLRSNYSLAELPIILLTARSGLENLVKGIDAGANDYITKPFAKDELLVRIKTQLQLQEAYHTFEENLRLKKDIERRKRTELDLQMIQMRLSRILDTVQEAMIAINESLEISFINASAKKLLGYETTEILGHPSIQIFSEGNRPELDTIFMNLFKETEGEKKQHQGAFTLAKKDGSSWYSTVMFTHLEMDHQQLLVLILGSEKEAVAEKVQEKINQNLALQIIEGLQLSQEKLQALENTLQKQPPVDMGKKVRNKLQLIQSTIMEMENRVSGTSDKVRKKKLALEAMNTALEYWQQTTGQGKVDLAEQSGIWKVYVNLDGFERTQTLDKYLDVNRFPKRPRWQNILETIEFVLFTCTTPSPARETLEKRFAQLRILQ